MAPSRSRGLAARAPLPAPAAVVPGARRAYRGRSVRPTGLGVHARLRVSGRVAGDADRQDDDQADAADRLAHGRADHQARVRRRARPRPARRSVRDRDRRGLLEAPAQLPDARRRPPATMRSVGIQGQGRERRRPLLRRVRPRPRVPLPAAPTARQPAARGARARDHGPVRPVPDRSRRPRRPGRVARPTAANSIRSCSRAPASCAPSRWT